MSSMISNILEEGSVVLLKPDISLDILRSKDFLFLNFSFYNAKIQGRDIVSKTPFKPPPVFAYVQIPSQHVAEELVTNPTELSRRKSLLSNSSYIALKLKRHTIKLREDELLDWENNFDVITIDSFLEVITTSKGNKFKKVGDVLENFKEEYDFINNKLHRNKFGGSEKMWPISTFELPYKMLLSPIAPEYKETSSVNEPNEKYLRKLGEFVFGHNKPRVLYNNKTAADFRKIFKPWENQLYFKGLDQVKQNPRFKIVDFNKTPDNIELLPAAVHRQELHNLTMLPPAERDVISDYFKLSSLGGSTKLKYKNEYPIKGTTIVEWNQTVKYARDNYVSITFRAVDVFTGIKLLVSVIAERKFSEGKSYLLKRYYISYLEKEKSYDKPINIGCMTFRKIIPQTVGKYCYPQQGNSNWYHVQEECFDEGRSFSKENDLEFKYLGIDKKGNTHQFNSKIIFIPAESYEITCGCYTYFLNGAKYGNCSQKKNVPITDIGGLDPRKNYKYKEDNNLPLLRECNITNDYEFQIKSEFGIKANINKILLELAKTIDEVNVKEGEKQDLRDHYSINIDSEFSFADIENIRKKDANGNEKNFIENRKQFFVKPNSENATFPTRSIFLFSVATNNIFSDANPLKPFLHSAEILISQIDQIEGESKYRTVALADDFYYNKKNRTTDFIGKIKDTNDELEQNNQIKMDKNPARLLFKLINKNTTLFDPAQNKINTPDQIWIEPLDNFFSDNYRKSGGMVNPGITISHISVLEKGITYNSSHNAIFKDMIDSNLNLSVNASSVFTKFEAEICGISLLDILEDNLPLDEIPDFSFVREVQDTFQFIQGTYSEWKQEYEDKKENFEVLKGRLRNLDKELLKLAKNELEYYLEGIIDQYNLVSFYQNQIKFLQEQSNEIDKYIAQLLTIEVELKNRISTTIKQKILKANEDLVNFIFNKIDLSITNIKDAIEEYAKNNNCIKELKELFKIYLLNEILKINKTEKISQEQNGTSFNTVLIYLSKEVEQVEQKYVQYYLALKTAIQEVRLFSIQYVNDEIKNLNCYISKKVGQVENKLLNEFEIIFDTNLNIVKDWISPVEELLKTYENYRSIFNLFKGGYYNQLTREIQANINLELEIIEEKLIENFKNKIECIKISNEYSDIQKKVNSLKKGIINQLLKVTNDGEELRKDLLSNYQNYEQKYNEILNEFFDKAISYSLIIDSRISIVKNQILIGKRELKELEDELTFFAKNKLQELEDEFDIQLEILKNNPEAKDAINKIEEIKRIKRKLQEASKQSLNYNFKTNKFRNADLGIIEFKANKATELAVDVNYNLEFDISQFDRPPTISKQSFVTNSTLSDFKIGFLKLINIDFERITFISGSEVKDDFKVNIRDIEFDGVLSFVKAFQSYLKNIDRNLVFDINSSGAMVGYNLPIPDITAGAFNFFNLSLSALLTLPFDPKKSLQLKFGLGSPNSKFAITYLIFGGQGYFLIIAEPKRGVVGLEVVLEFGAIFYLNLGVANGVAYLVGGIFIKKYNGLYDIRGYILCVGRFNIISLFSASISFYLGLQGDGRYLEGVCIVKVTKRFSRFFKVSVSCKMRKTITGTKSAKATNKLINEIECNGSTYIQGNILKEDYILKEELVGKYITISSPIENDFSLIFKSLKGDHIELFGERIETKVCSNNLINFRIDSVKGSQFNEGKYDVILRNRNESRNLETISEPLGELEVLKTVKKDKIKTKNKAKIGSQCKHDFSYFGAYY